MVDFSTYLTIYGKEIGLPNLKFNDQGICSLNFNSSVDIDIVYQKDIDQCIFAAPIIDIPATGQEELFRRILTENVFGIATAGATFGIEEEKNRIVLSYTFITSTFSFDLFKTVLGNFVDLVEDWKKKCEEFLTDYDSQGTGPYSSLDNMQFIRG